VIKNLHALRHHRLRDRGSHSVQQRREGSAAGRSASSDVRALREAVPRLPQGNPALAQETAQNLCLKGMSGKYEDMFGARYRAMIECTKTATTCEALEKCNESE
jgi:hypothetical protein